MLNALSLAALLSLGLTPHLRSPRFFSCSLPVQKEGSNSLRCTSSGQKARHYPVTSSSASQGSGEPSEKRNRQLQFALLGVAFGAVVAFANRSSRMRLLLGCAWRVLPPIAISLLPFGMAFQLFRKGNKRGAYRIAIMAIVRRFCVRWWQYLTIPLFAALVGWLTNKVAVDMIFYPLHFTGIEIKTYPGQPLGWIGWQGIVPAKAAMMARRSA